MERGNWYNRCAPETGHVTLDRPGEALSRRNVVCTIHSRHLSDSQTAISASVVKLVDTMDSKSIAFTGVAVRVRPLVPPTHLVESKFFCYLPQTPLAVD